MTFEQIISDLNKKVYYPVYLLMGEEPYYIDVIADHIADNVLDENEREFNQSILYGKDTDVVTVINAAKRYPMMANHQVLVIKEAQSLNKIEELAKYLENPLKSTILVLCHKYKTVDKRKQFYKLCEKNGVVFTSNRLYDNQIPDWITKFLKQKNYKIQPQAATLLAENLGADLSKIVNEISKLIINVPPDVEITAAIIEKNIGISKDFNVFELQKALSKKDIYKANQIINYFAANAKDNPMIMVISSLFQFFTKVLLYHAITVSVPEKDRTNSTYAAALSINPFFLPDYKLAASNYPLEKVRQIISILQEYDLKSKGIDNASIEEGELQKEMIYKILH